MDKKTVSKRKKVSSSCTKLVKEAPGCIKCKAKSITDSDHYCECKTGIVNLGNSCYMSAVFQIVSELHLYQTLPPDGQLYNTLERLNEFGTSAACLDLALYEIKDLWQHENLQEDAYEFFITILPLLDSSQFGYEYLSQRYCEICHKSFEAVVREDCCFNMVVDKPLQEQLDGTVDPIDEVCENCGEGFLMKLRSFMKEPKVLMVRIMRFQINLKTGKPSKIWNKVKLEEEVTVAGRVYKLECVILHKSKALNHGHYLAYLHRKKILIDDEKVHYNTTLKLDCSYFYIAFYV